MRDPELMQRADRAAIALEEAWERWRAMHGLGSEPLPPVSSYVGYSLEEPWGQPRVVFGLRADEAELLASLLDGHDCVGPIYAEVSTRPGWRRPLDGPAQLPRPYANPLSVPAQVSVPAQAPPSPLDQVRQGGATDDDRADGTDEMDAPGPVADGLAEIDSDMGTDAASEDHPRTAKAGRPGTEPEAEPGLGGRAEAGGTAQSAPLAPLPEAADPRRDDEATAADQARQGSSKRSATRPNVPTQGPGYRGPRYQGSPPRYETGAARAAAKVPDDNDGETDAEPSARRSHVTKLNRGTRRRPSGG